MDGAILKLNTGEMVEGDTITIGGFVLRCDKNVWEKKLHRKWYQFWKKERVITFIVSK